MLKKIIIKSLLLFLPLGVFAHGAEEEDGVFLNELISQSSLSLAVLAGFLITFLIIIAAAKKEKSEFFKGVTFILISIITIATTFYLSASTVYLNLVSESGGPVHWHADYRIFRCGEELELVDPENFSNRIGTSVLHEHNDGRIHVEGVVVKKNDASLHKFFEVVGGDLSLGKMVLPTEKGLVAIKNFDRCPGSGREGIWQVFLYKTEGNRARQFKLENYPEYTISPFSTVPPGDCLIFEFDSEEKEKTERLCRFYEIEIKKGELILEK